MTITLAIETSTPLGGVALFKDQEMLRLTRFAADSPASQRLIPAIAELVTDVSLKPEDIDVFAVSIGPGSFTGLRVGLTAVKTLAGFLDKRIVPIPTLMALAFSAGSQPEPVGAVLDARKNEVYGAYFNVTGQGVKRLSPDVVLPITTFLENRPAEKIHLIGSGVKEYQQEIDSMSIDWTQSPDNLGLPSPEHIGKLSLTGSYDVLSGESVHQLLPVYLRRSEAEINWAKKFDSD